MSTKFLKLYLSLVPLLVVITGFAIGPVSPAIYLPVWGIHACLMVFALWKLGAHAVTGSDEERKKQAMQALLLTAPWLFLSVFFGMGPPPGTIAEWVAAATEQQARYVILIACGVMVTAGLALLREQLNKAGEGFYSMLGITAVLIAAPLFIINMAFWGSFLTQAFRFFVAVPGAPRPDWYNTLKELLYMIGLVEVAFIYLATAAFAASLRKAGWFRPVPCRLYILFSLLGCILNCLPPSVPGPLGFIAYFVSIPAIPFVMPYLMGLNLLKRTGGAVT
jgi:hypothetical protein